MNENKLEKALQDRDGLSEQVTSYVAYEIAKGNIKIEDGKKLTYEFFWVLNAMAWAFCNHPGIRRLIREKKLPALNEKGMRTLDHIREKSDRFFTLLGEGTEEKHIVPAGIETHRDVGGVFLNEDNLDIILSHFPYVILSDKGFKNYIGDDHLEHTDIYRMINRVTNLIFKAGKTYIWPTIPKDDKTRKGSWQGVSYKDIIAGLYCYPDEDLPGYSDFLEPYAPEQPKAGRKRKIDDKEENPVNHLYVFCLRGHDWGLALLKSCILGRINFYDRVAHKMKPNAQVLFFTMLWVPGYKQDNFWLHDEDICKILNWKYPQERIERLRKRIRKLLVYMWNEGALKKYPKPNKNHWPVIPDPWFTRRKGE